ncbi:MAG: YkgJ family cysteine cluster protein [Firmicutes bacterium]|nr:YkgJ family cysteine cluster protein [Bacillota bacterium]
MIKPNQVKQAAAEMEYQNEKFRRFLKTHAKEKELDEQFLRLHNELFKNYDCGSCRNCCKMYHAELSKSDIEKGASYLGISAEKFIDTYLKRDEYEIGYISKNKPCDFLREDGECLLGECKPQDCKDYPYTNQPERLHSLMSFLEHIEVCPVAYEICEGLKKEYRFN